jgi:hypothetical protein
VSHVRFERPSCALHNCASNSTECELAQRTVRTSRAIKPPAFVPMSRAVEKLDRQTLPLCFHSSTYCIWTSCAQSTNVATAHDTTRKLKTALHRATFVAHPILHIDRSLVLLRATVLLAPLAPSGSLATRRDVVPSAPVVGGKN